MFDFSSEIMLDITVALAPHQCRLRVKNTVSAVENTSILVDEVSNMIVVWDYFILGTSNSKNSHCKICNMGISVGVTTSKGFGMSDLIQHLKINHAKKHCVFL